MWIWAQNRANGVGCSVRKASYGGSLFLGETLEMFTYSYVALRSLVESGWGPWETPLSMSFVGDDILTT